MIAKQDPEVNQVDLGFFGFPGYSGSSTSEFEESDSAQVQGKPRMHLTLP